MTEAPHAAKPHPTYQPFEADFELERPGGGPVVDWCEIVVPRAAWRQPDDGQSLRADIGYGPLFPVVYSHDKGAQGVAVRVLVPFKREGIISARIGTVDGPPAFSDFVLHPSIPDDPDPVIDSQEFVLATTVRGNAAEQLGRLVYESEDGNRTIIWRLSRTLSPVFRYVVRFTRDQLGDGTFPGSIDFGDGAQVHILPGSQYQGFRVQGSKLVCDLGHQLDYACAPTLRLHVTYPPQSDEGPIEERLRADAPRRWAVGRYVGYRQRGVAWPSATKLARVLTLGVGPESTPAAAKKLIAECRTRGRGMGSIYERRPASQNLVTSNAGTQRFGCAFSGAALLLTPAEENLALEVVAQDEELRPVHLYEQDGHVLRAMDHPDCRFHNRRIHWRNAKDKLGLPHEPPKKAKHSGRNADDLQHTDESAIDEHLSRYDCPALEETRRHTVELDAMDDALLNGRFNSAARGWGRPALAIANAAFLFRGDDTGTLAQGVAIATLHAALKGWEGGKVPAGRPVRPMRTLKGVESWALVDPRTRQPMRVAAPYEHAECVKGAIALAQVLPDQQAREALGLAAMLTITCLHWLYTDAAGKLQWPFIVGVLEGAEDGDPLPSAWHVPDSDEFRMTHQDGGSWTRWTAPAAYAVPYLIEALGRPAMEAIGLTAELEQAAARVREQLDVEDEALDDKLDDELYRMTAMPQSLEEARPLAFA